MRSQRGPEVHVDQQVLGKEGGTLERGQRAAGGPPRRGCLAPGKLECSLSLGVLGGRSSKLQAPWLGLLLPLLWAVRK